MRLDGVRTHFADWHIYVSPTLTDTEYAAEEALGALASHKNVVRDEAFHLTVSMRSFRSENVSAFVKAVLDCDEPRAREMLGNVARLYPLAISRN